MPEFGLGNFLYELSFDGKAANFKFRDPLDVTNTAEVSIVEADFPENVSADSRQVADLAYAQCQQVLNEKRDKRIARESKAATDKKAADDASDREAAADFLNKAQQVAVAPAKVEKDGTTVYNTANVGETDDSDSESDSKSKK